MSVTPRPGKRAQRPRVSSSPRAKKPCGSSRAPGDLPRGGDVELRTEPPDSEDGCCRCEGHHSRREGRRGRRGRWDAVIAGLEDNGCAIRLCLILIVMGVALAIPPLAVMLAHTYLGLALPWV
jgi:hypothetical protein